MSLALCLLSWAPPADGLGSPDYATREATQRFLTRTWPLSRPAIEGLKRSPEPEVRRRATEADRAGADRFPNGRVVKGILDRGPQAGRLWWLLSVDPALVRWDMVDLALKDESNYRMLALWMMLAPFPGSLEYPEAYPRDFERKYAGDMKLRVALCDLAKATWRGPDGKPVVLKCDPVRYPNNTDLGALQAVRLWIRGIPSPYVSTTKPGEFDKALAAYRRNAVKGLPVPPPPKVASGAKP